jgi:hypothetical protein
MPLAKYIEHFQGMEKSEQILEIRCGTYSGEPGHLETLLRYTDDEDVRDAIRTKLGRENVAATPSSRSVAVVEPDSNPHQVGFSLDLQSLAAHVNYRYEMIKNPSRAASRAVVEIGFLVMIAKRELPHGSLNKWLMDNTKINDSWAQYCRRAAEKFCKAHGEQALLTLCNPSADNAPEAVKEAEQLMMDFTGGVGPTALLHNLGIKKRAGSESSEKTVSPQEARIFSLRNSWTEIVNAIVNHNDDWAELSADEIAAIHSVIWPMAKKMNQVVKGK